MKKQFLLIVSAVFLLSSSAIYLTRKYDPASGDFILEKKDAGKGAIVNKDRDALGALKWRFDKLKDENGNVDPSYFQNAMAHADLMKQYGSRSALGLQWEELGPDDVGGRTRAILIDKRDPTRNTIYAGGVSGGMWKSTDGGNTWNRLTNWNQWLAVSCITQGPDKTIYIGTGEGLATCGSTPCGSNFLSGSTGNGVFTLDANDNQVPFAFDSVFHDNWLDNSKLGTTINRIAVDPQDGTQIVVATGNGLWQTQDGGGTWQQVNIQGIQKGQFVADVKWGNDGLNIFAAIGSILPSNTTHVNLVMSPDGGQNWYAITRQNNTGFPFTLSSQQGRIEIAIAPSDPNYVYILVADKIGATYGLYRTTNAVDLGATCTWSALATNGPLFDPFTSGETQGWYDNTIAINPFNPTKVYIGGVNFYTWSDITDAKLADAGLGGGAVNPYYIHPDKHTIVFSDLDSNTMFVGCDGGVYKSTDASVDFPFPTFTVKNRGYDVTQNYSVGAAITGEVMGGSQDNGTNYINYKGNTPMSAIEILGGDGSYAEISHLDPRIFFGGIYYGNYVRSGNYGASFDPFYDGKIDPAGYNQPSGCIAQKNYNAPFIDVMYLSETKHAANGARTVAFVPDKIYNTGDVISLQSNTAKYPFQFTLTAPLTPNDTQKVNDPVRSRIFVSSNCGSWVTSDALDLSNIPRWYSLLPVNTTGAMTGIPDSYAATGDGDVLYVGTSTGYVYRFANMNAHCDTTIYPIGSKVGILYPTSNSSYSSSLVAGGNRDIEGINVDPNDNNHVVAVLAGYSTSNQPHVYESHDGGQTWVADTAGLPNMPVYNVVVHDANTIIIGSELGIWSWDGSQWNEENNGMQRVPVYRLIEKELYTEGCKVLYIGTHGRGMWRSTTLTASGCQTVAGINTGINNIKAPEISGMNIFPNPVRTTSQISLSLDKNADVVLRIFDMTGKLCSEIAHKNAIAGENLFELNATGLSSGTYLLSATAANARTQSRLFMVSR